ncbi:MAG: hypothetical protein ACR2M7_06210 [Bdellovibrionales bacterium]
MKFNFLGVFLGFLTLASCQIFTKTTIKPSDLSTVQLQQMDQALIYVRNKDFKKAVHIYDQLIKELKDKPVEAVMLFNSGSNYRFLGNCERSIFRYRRMLERSMRQLPLKSRGLIEISYSYECLGDFKAAFVSLKDAENLKKYLPLEINQVIYPARLSLAYARFGKTNQANQYKEEAFKNILYFKNRYKDPKDMSENISRIFYVMGQSYLSKKLLAENKQLASYFLQAFPYHQTYLLQSLFVGHKKWSYKSQQEIQSLFDKLRLALLSSSPKVKKTFKKQLQDSLKEGRAMVEREGSLKWQAFYQQQTKKIGGLL